MNYKINRIFDWFKYDLKYGIKNLIRWFVIIWKDRNWDYYFIYVMLQYKLKFMENVIRDSYIGSNKEADKIKKCVLLLDRLIKDEYHENEFKKHDIKWGECKFRTEKCKDNDELYEFFIDYENIKTKEDDILEKDDARRCIKHSQYLRKQDVDMLFEILRKNIEGWWN